MQESSMRSSTTEKCSGKCIVPLIQSAESMFGYDQTEQMFKKGGSKNYNSSWIGRWVNFEKYENSVKSRISGLPPTTLLNKNKGRTKKSLLKEFDDAAVRATSGTSSLTNWFHYLPVLVAIVIVHVSFAASVCSALLTPLASACGDSFCFLLLVAMFAVISGVMFAANTIFKGKSVFST